MDFRYACLGNHVFQLRAGEFSFLKETLMSIPHYIENKLARGVIDSVFRIDASTTHTFSKIAEFSKKPLPIPAKWMKSNEIDHNIASAEISDFIQSATESSDLVVRLTNEQLKKANEDRNNRVFAGQLYMYGGKGKNCIVVLGGVISIVLAVVGAGVGTGNLTIKYQESTLGKLLNHVNETLDDFQTVRERVGEQFGDPIDELDAYIRMPVEYGGIVNYNKAMDEMFMPDNKLEMRTKNLEVSNGMTPLIDPNPYLKSVNPVEMFDYILGFKPKANSYQDQKEKEKVLTEFAERVSKINKIYRQNRGVVKIREGNDKYAHALHGSLSEYQNKGYNTIGYPLKRLILEKTFNLKEGDGFFMSNLMYKMLKNETLYHPKAVGGSSEQEVTRESMSDRQKIIDDAAREVISVARQRVLFGVFRASVDMLLGMSIYTTIGPVAVTLFGAVSAYDMHERLLMIRVALHEYTNLMYAFNTDRTTSLDGIGIKNTERNDKTGKADFFSYQFDSQIALLLYMYITLGVDRYLLKNPQAKRRATLDRLQMLHRLITILEILYLAVWANHLGIPNNDTMVMIMGFGTSFQIVWGHIFGGITAGAGIIKLTSIPGGIKTLFYIIAGLITQIPTDDTFTDEERQAIQQASIYPFIKLCQIIFNGSQKREGSNEGDQQFLEDVQKFIDANSLIEGRTTTLTRQRSRDNLANLPWEYDPNDDETFPYDPNFDDRDIKYDENFFGENDEFQEE